ncbi:MAG: phytase [Armatimonas sp.]
MTPFRLSTSLQTAPVANDPDDPAVWVDSRNPGRSLILGTNKVSKAEGGSLYVFSLSGSIVKVVSGLDRPNNVAIVKNWAVVTERLQNRLRVFRLPDLAPVGEIPCGPEPMGIAAWGNDSVLVSLKKSPLKEPLTRWKLVERGGKVEGIKLQTIGTFSGKKEIEAIAVDARWNQVYYADEGHGVRVWRGGKEIGLLGPEFTGDQEGIALFGNYIACNEQIPLAQGGSLLHIYDRRTLKKRAIFATGADETDGIEIDMRPLGPKFPRGILVAMNSGPKNFLVFDLRQILAKL